MLEALSIVRMKAEHISDVMVVEKLSFAIPWTRNAFVEELTNNKFALYISAVQSGRAIGYAGMWKVFDEGHITNIAVHPEFRQCGVGTRLMQGLVELAGDSGINRMTLEVRKSNISAQGLYSKFGFVAAGVRKRYYSDNNEDALIMWKESM